MCSAITECTSPELTLVCMHIVCCYCLFTHVASLGVRHLHQCLLPVYGFCPKENLRVRAEKSLGNVHAGMALNFCYFLVQVVSVNIRHVCDCNAVA